MLPFANFLIGFVYGNSNDTKSTNNKIMSSAQEYAWLFALPFLLNTISYFELWHLTQANT